jgi:hypothetical protein
MNWRLWRILPMTGVLVATAVMAKDIAPADIRVLTGDTIVAHGETYRLVGFDTPETAQAHCPSERKLGYRATFRLRRIIAGGALDLGLHGKPRVRDSSGARAKRGRDDGRQRIGAAVHLQHRELSAAQGLVRRRDARLDRQAIRLTTPLSGPDLSRSRERSHRVVASRRCLSRGFRQRHAGRAPHSEACGRRSRAAQCWPCW